MCVFKQACNLKICERTRVDEAQIWPQILSKVPNHYHINIFLIIERQHASVQKNVYKIPIMHPVLPWEPNLIR